MCRTHGLGVFVFFFPRKPPDHSKVGLQPGPKSRISRVPSAAVTLMFSALPDHRWTNVGRGRVGGRQAVRLFITILRQNLRSLIAHGPHVWGPRGRASRLDTSSSNHVSRLRFGTPMVVPARLMFRDLKRRPRLRASSGETLRRGKDVWRNSAGRKTLEGPRRFHTPKVGRSLRPDRPSPNSARA